MLASTRTLSLTIAFLSLGAAGASAQQQLPPRPDFAAAPGWNYVFSAKCWAHFPDGAKGIEPLLAQWTGKCVDQKISGTGTLNSLTDFSIVGEFANGELKGTGKVSWTGGMVTYDGTFSEGALRGTGKGEWADGSHYQGGFIDNKFDGQGRWDISSTVYYEGAFKNGVMYGQGKLTFPQGTIEGQFNSWVPYTEATFTAPGQAPVSGILQPPVNVATAPITPPEWPAALRPPLIATAHFIVLPDGTPTDIHAYTSQPGKTGVPEDIRLGLEKAIAAARFAPAKIGETVVPMPFEFSVAYQR